MTPGRSALLPRHKATFLGIKTMLQKVDNKRGAMPSAAMWREHLLMSQDVAGNAALANCGTAACKTCIMLGQALRQQVPAALTCNELQCNFWLVCRCCD